MSRRVMNGVHLIVGTARALLRRLLGLRSHSLEAMEKGDEWLTRFKEHHESGEHYLVGTARALRLEDVTTAYCRATPNGLMEVGVYGSVSVCRTEGAQTLAYYEDYDDALEAVEALAQHYNVRSYTGAPARKRNYPAGSDGVG